MSTRWKGCWGCMADDDLDGTNEIMGLVIQHEYYREVLESRENVCDVDDAGVPY